MARLGVLLFLVQIVLAVCALISCLSAEEGKIRALPRIAWVLIILFFPLVGSIAWFIVGREPSAGARKGWPGGTGGASGSALGRWPPTTTRSSCAPSRNAPSSRTRSFPRWEEDLRRREDDLRRRDGEPPREGDRPEV